MVVSGDEIASKVIQQFSSIRVKSAKPTVRSNGVKEWTVLASIVAIIGDDVNPIAVTTGVKCLPDKIRAWSNGLVVHDMHAEILALRAFNWFLLGECKEQSRYLVKYGEKYRLRDEVKLALFLTEPPCGDASIGYLRDTKDDKEPWAEKTLHTEEIRSDGKRRKVIRGRAHFDREGIVRTKPGRSDSIETLSKSCSDKLCLKQLVGINSSITSDIIEPIYLDYLVLKEGKFKMEDFERCFHSRFSIKVETDGGKRLKLLTYTEDKYEYHKEEDRVPSPISLVYLSTHTPTVHVLNNGVKNGSYVKNKSPRAGGESILCNVSMYKESKRIRQYTSSTYIDYKNSLKERNRLKERAKKLLGNWHDTTKDDFPLT